MDDDEIDIVEALHVMAAHCVNGEGYQMPAMSELLIEAADEITALRMRLATL